MPSAVSFLRKPTPPPPPVSCLPPATHESMGLAAPPPTYGVEEVDVIIDIE